MRHGGYATLVGLTRNSETYACGIDIVGPSNFETLIRTIPPYWEAIRSQVLKAIGDPDTEEGLSLLRERSPLFQAGRITKLGTTTFTSSGGGAARRHIRRSWRPGAGC